MEEYLAYAKTTDYGEESGTEKAPLPNYQEGTILTDRPLLRMQRHVHAQKARPWPSPQHVI